MVETEIARLRQREADLEAQIGRLHDALTRQAAARASEDDDLAFLQGGGEMGTLMRSHDWTSTALKHPSTWPQSLQSVLSACLNSPMLGAVLWGPDFLFLYNDAYIPSLAERHPHALGRPVAEVWGDTWDQVSASFYEAMATGHGFSQSDVPLQIIRHGELETTWWDFTATPIRGENGTVVGLLNQGTETTARVRIAAELRASEERNRQILDSATDFAIVATDLGGLVTQWSEGARRVLGWSEAEMLGQPVERFFTPKDVAAGRVATEMRNALDTGRGNDERWHQRKSGERFWAVGEMTVLRDEGKGAVGFVKILQDRTEQRHAEEQRRADAEFMRGVLASSSDCIEVLDLDGNLVFMSEGGQRVMEVSDFDAIKGCPWPDFWQGQGRTEARAALDAAKAGDTGHFQGPADTMAGNARYWDVRVTPVMGPDGRPEKLLSISRDITTAWHSEQALRELNDTLEQRVREQTRERDRVWRNAQDMIVIIDKTGTFRDVNPAVARVLGWTADEMIGRTVFDFILDEDTPSTQGALEHAGREQLPVYVNRYRHKDGSFRWISWVAAPENDLIYAYGRDVTEEKERAAMLLLHENIMQSSVAPICAFDTDYRLIAFNRAHSDEFFRIYQYRVQIGDVFPDLLPPDQAPVMRALMARALTGEVFSVEEEFGDPEIVKPRWELHYAPLRDATGQIIGAFHFARDISDRLRTQAELGVAQDALRQSQKMEAVGQLTGGIAHDFNNLLTGISGSLDLLQKRVAQGRVNDLDRYLIAAQGASKRAAALTHRLLAFSRRQTLDPKPTDVHKLVLGMADLIRRTVGPEITVETVDMVGLWPALVDPPQLENALLNLCINARDAMPDGGRITIETANRWMDQRTARERDVDPGQYLSLCVSDTGTGMPADVVARAFDPFFTTKPLGQGTGLGLSMIYGFVRQSGGQVRIYSEIGQGTMVCIYLPRHYGESSDAAQEGGRNDEAEPRAVQGETVLVVDDEPTVRMLVADVLGDLGYGALEAEDGASGLKILQSRARVDLLITDVGLPGGMNGRQVADAARVLRPGLKVLFITGYAENAVVGNGHLDPGMAVLTKPFAMDDLAAKIRALIEE